MAISHAGEQAGICTFSRNRSSFRLRTLSALSQHNTSISLVITQADKSSWPLSANIFQEGAIKASNNGGKLISLTAEFTYLLALLLLWPLRFSAGSTLCSGAPSAPDRQSLLSLPIIHLWPSLHVGNLRRQRLPHKQDRHRKHPVCSKTSPRAC